VTFSTGQRAIVADASVAVDVLRSEPLWTARWQEWLRRDALILVPAHFAAEVANALLRSAKLPAGDVDMRLEFLDQLHVEVADRGLPGIRGAVRLADQHGLSVYDAAYLELAIDVDGELATLDRALARAAAAEGVDVIG
jgi:predicted nucleic acid-binding protein